MNHKFKYLALLLLLSFFMPMRSQQIAVDRWREVDSLTKLQYYDAAYNKAAEIYNKAVASGDSRLSLEGAYRLSLIGSEYKEDNADSTLALFERLLPTLTPVDQSICRLFLANFYLSYYRNYKWQIIQHKPTDEAELDYKLWDEERYRKTIYGLMREAFADVKLLQNTPSESMGALFKKSSGKDGNLTPTIFDVAMNLAVEMIHNMPFPMLQVFDVDKPELLYAEAGRFIKIKVKNENDTTKEAARFVFGLMQEWERYRGEREDAGMMMELYCRRLDYINSIIGFSNETQVGFIVQEMPKVIDYYRNSNDDHITTLYYKLAQYYDGLDRKEDAVNLIDTAITLFPESPGAIYCYNLKQRLLSESIKLDVTQVWPSDRHQLAFLYSQNVERVYFRIIKDFEFKWNSDENAKKKLASQKVLKQWSQDIEIKKKYDGQRTYFTIPPMSQGKYILMASCDPDFENQGISFTDFAVEDVAIVDMRGIGKGRGVVIDRITGKPVANQVVRLRTRENYNGKWRVRLEQKTDENGYFDFSSYFSSVDDKTNYYHSFSTIYKGFEISSEESFHYYDYSSNGNKKQKKDRLFFDRPVYKPGDTVRFAILMYENNRREGSVIKDNNVLVYVKDINRVVDTLRLKTDEYGVCEGEYILAADAMPGSWRILVRGETNYDYPFNVEAYKQPKFTVTLSKPKQERRFGQTATVEGIAASYTSVPLGGAMVKYRVERSFKPPFWRWNWMYEFGAYNMKSTTVASGELTTDDNGQFKIEFIPQPDSSYDITLKPCFNYVVYAYVTDINGETHSAQTTLAVGYENSYVRIAKNETDRDDVAITVNRCNLDGNPIDGRLSFEVFRLQQPGSPKLIPDIMDNPTVNMPLTRSEFEKLFPLYDYDGSVSDYKKWPEQKKVYNTTANLTSDKPYKYKMKGLAEGVYKFVATIVTEQGDTLKSTDYIVYEPTKARKPVCSNLISGHFDKTTCEVGDTIHVQLGSLFKDVDMYVVVCGCDTVFRTGKVTASANYVNIDIPVGERMLGGFSVSIVAMKENYSQNVEERIDVPYSQKKLDITFETFRDKLEPGDKEQWTIRIKDDKSGLASKANLLLSMYDHSLDTYSNLNYYFKPWHSCYSSPEFSRIVSHDMCHYYFAQPFAYKTYDSYDYTRYYFYCFSYIDRIVAAVAGVGYGTARGEDGMVTQAGNLRRNASKGFVSEDVEVMTELGIVDDEEELFELSDGYALNSVVVKAQKNSVIDIGEAETGARLSVSDADNGQNNETPVYVRQNLNTLAFFKPTLRSDDSGTVSISFAVPDLLTEWNIKGLAWTKELSLGTVDAKAITQKRLMAIPNVPRFLRQGDTCIFSVKVSNLDIKEQQIAVTLDLSTPQLTAFNSQKEHLALKPNASGEVHFTIVVPENIYVLDYKVVARGQGCSDGEQAPIPILPGRQLVTESMAFYINGKDTKQYELSHLTSLQHSNVQTLQHHSLTVDLTPNPIWLAIQSLPYVQRQKNPSNIFLANAIFTNSLAFKIVKDNPQIEQLFATWRKYGSSAFQSELDRNADLKQAVMDETPWLQDAVAEEQRHRDIARYFDKMTLQSQLTSLTSKLVGAQRSDGGWSWIEGGRYSSQYTTQYILKTLGQLQQQGVKVDYKTKAALKSAMEYVDRETYKYYQKYVKGKGYDVVNLDYLYIRSLYPDNKLTKRQQEAYDFFYNNAKKYNEEYSELYTQAMLCLVFHRNGDTKLAKEMAKRIKQKALFSDEMGMYWRDNRGGWLWNQRPIETQAMLIRTIAEVLGDSGSVAKMQQWLLKQKQTTNWNTDVATVNAIQALLVGNPQSATGNSQFTIHNSQLSVRYGSHELKTDTAEAQLHISHRLEKDEISPSDGRITVSKADDGIAWGAMYWQYFENLDKIPASSMGVTLSRTLYKVENENRLSAIKTSSYPLKVGDKLRVRIEIVCDRTLEYLELKDPRCAALEPVTTASGWCWNSGLSYYRAVTNTAQHLYIDRLEKGKYVVEYDLYVNNAGVYTTAPTTIQCLYAPEFRAVCPAEKLIVE